MTFLRGILLRFLQFTKHFSNQVGKILLDRNGFIVNTFRLEMSMIFYSMFYTMNAINWTWGVNFQQNLTFIEILFNEKIWFSELEDVDDSAKFFDQGYS